MCHCIDIEANSVNSSSRFEGFLTFKIVATSLFNQFQCRAIMDPETMVTDLGDISSRLIVACQMKYNSNRGPSRRILGRRREIRRRGAVISIYRINVISSNRAFEQNAAN
jgi:hypothetical protein